MLNNFIKITNNKIYGKNTQLFNEVKCLLFISFECYYKALKFLKIDKCCNIEAIY